jgi:hypothetical protein
MVIPVDLLKETLNEINARQESSTVEGLVIDSMSGKGLATVVSSADVRRIPFEVEGRLVRFRGVLRLVAL